MNYQRKRLLVDREVQVGMATRALWHWFTFLVAAVIALPLMRAIVLGDVSTPFFDRLAAAGVDAAILGAVFVSLLPYFLYDTFRATNRFAGPIYRLQHNMRAIARGGQFEPLRFRKRDYWRELAQDFNAMVDTLQTDAASHEPSEEELADAIG